MKYRVFKYNVAWSEALLIFHPDITFKEILNNPFTNRLHKNDFIGEYEFDEKFLEFFILRMLNDKPYWYKHFYDNK